jgi:hypothetical protein
MDPMGAFRKLFLTAKKWSTTPRLHHGIQGRKKLPKKAALQLQGFAYDPAAIPVFTEKDILIP